MKILTYKKLLHLWVKCIITFVGDSKLLHLWVKCVITFVGDITFVGKVILSRKKRDIVITSVCLSVFICLLTG